MKNDIKYIDKLTADKLKDFEHIPDTSWDTFNTNNSSELIVEESAKFSTGNYITTKNVIFTVAGISILTAGILLNGNENYKKGLKSVNKNKNTEKLYVIPNNKIINIESDTLNADSKINTKDSTIIKQNEEHVVIRVKVPIIKNIEIKEKVYIENPNLKEDSVINN